MKLTQEKLMQIIRESMQDIDEGFGDAYAGETHRAASAFDQQAIMELAMEFESFIMESPAANKIQPPKSRSIVQACQMAVDAIEAGEPVAIHATAGMQESNKS